MAEANIAGTLGIELTMVTAGAIEQLGRLKTAIDQSISAGVQKMAEIEQASKSAIDTSGGVREMQALATATAKAADDVAGEMARVGAAVRKATDMAAPTAQVISFASAMGEATAGAAALRREANASEKAGEALSASLQRQIQFFGMTRDEVAQTKIAMAALRAEQNGQTELASRLRDQADQLYALQFAAARKAQAIAASADEDRAAAADLAELTRAAGTLRTALDPLGAAEARAGAEIAEVTRMFAAGVITLDEYAAAEARTRATLEQTTASIEKQAAAARAAASASVTPMRAVGATTGGTGNFIGAGSAQASAQAIAELLAEEERLEARTKSLIATIDPMAAAQARANAVAAEARELYAAQRISAEQLAAAEKIAADAMKEHGSAAGFNRTQLMIAESAAHRFADSIMAGMSPMRAFMMQAGDIGNILAMDSGGVAGGLAKVRALLNPVTLGIGAAAIAAVAGAAAWLSYSNALDRMSALAQGSGAVIGATGAQLEQLAEKGAAAGNVSVGSARDMIGAYVQMGGIGTNVLGGLVDLTANFAKATGVDAAEAEKELGAAFQDPAKGAEDLATKFGALSAAQVEHIQKLVEQNDKYGAQAALLAALGPQFDGAASHANVLAQAWHWIAVNASDAWTAMGKAIDRALGGGSAMDKLADLERQRTSLLASNANGAVAQIDQQIAAVRAQIAKEKAEGAAQAGVAAARSKAMDALKIAGASTGDTQLDGLRASLAKVNGVLADTTNRAHLSASQLGQLRTAQDQYTHAVTTYIPAADRAAKVAALEAQAEATKDPAQKRALATQKSLIEQSGQLVTGAQAQAKATGDGAKAYQQAQNAVDSAAASAAKAAAHHAEELARNAAAQEAQIRNLYAVADAYKVSDAAALIAEARTKAESEAIKARGDIEAAVTRQIQILVAQRVADGEKEAAGLRAQADAQRRVSDQVAAGTIPLAQAGDALRDLIQLRPLEQAMAAAQARGDATAAQRAQAAIDDLKDAQLGYNAARRAAQFTANAKASTNDLAVLRAELSLVGATDAARARALATIRAQQQAEREGLTVGTAQYAQRVQQLEQVAAAQQQVQQATDDFNSSIEHQATLWDAVASNVDQAAQDISTALGSVGSAIGGLASAFTDLQAKQSAMAAEETARLSKLTEGTTAYNNTVAEFAARGSQLQVKAYGDMISSAEGFFKKGTAGYKAMQTAEKVYRAYELASAIANAARQIGLIGGVSAAKTIASSMAMKDDATETFASVANSGTRAAADGSAAIAKTAASVPFPGNIAAVAAVAAMLVGFGVTMLGHGGGGGGAAAYAQGNTGTGTVFGDGSAQSESVKNSIDALRDVDTTVMNTSREMLQALKSIDSQIGGLTNSLINAGNIGSIVGVSDSKGGLFGSSKKVIGSGIAGDNEALGDILASGAYATSYYADVEKKKKFLGITTGTSFKTKYADNGTDVDQQFARILQGFATTIEDAAGPLGLATDAVEAKLDSFVVSIGRVDLKGLSGEEIQKKLAAVLSAEGDRLAAAAIPGLSKYQEAGEGYLETLTRVASTVETVTGTLEKLGVSTSKLGVDADMGIAKQFDSLSDFSDAAKTYFEDFYSKEEQAAAQTAQLGKVFASLGLQMPDTLDGFRKLVEAQDLTTASGQATYATLLQIAPAFSDLKTAMDGAKSAADILSEREDLQRQLLEIEGDTAAIRALDIQKIDENNRALQQEVWARQDAADAAAKAAQAEQQLASQRASLEGQVLQLTGDTAEIRRRELAALDPSLRAIQERIFALTDEQAATKAATAAAEAAAQAEEQARQEAASKAAAFAQERGGLWDQIFDLEGNTAAQRYKALQALDPANRSLQEYIWKLQDQKIATDAAAEAAAAAAQKEQAIAQERQGLMQQLYELTGNTKALRDMQLAALDPSNRALQQQIWAISDAQEAAKAAQDLSDAWKSVGDTLLDEVKRIRGLSETVTGGGYAALLGRFNAATASARDGDQDAAKSLPDLSKSLLDAAAEAATSRQELARIQAQTAASLEATYAVITAATMASDKATSSVLPQATGGGSTSLSSQSWWSTFASSAAATRPTSSNDNATAAEVRALRAELAGFRKDNNDGNAQIAGNTGRAAKILDNVTGDTGGNAIRTEAA